MNEEDKCSTKRNSGEPAVLSAVRLKRSHHAMNRFFLFVLSSLVLVSGSALCAESPKGKISIDDKSLNDVPEPIKCYGFLGDITGDKEMPVGLAVQLCAGTKNARTTLVCYKMALEALELNRGLAIELCGEKRKLQ
jgi:hypothetical protein